MAKVSLDALNSQFENKGYNIADMKALLEEEISKSNVKFVVLDDDPTGVQTVHDITVFTDWSVDSIKRGFQLKDKLFFILTNSRGLTAGQTTKLHREIAQNVITASEELNQEFIIISRSDSTLRGHYPLETKLLKECIENGKNTTIHGEILFPFFKEGGRYTANDIHYVNYGGQLTPAGETEFAKDKTFGFTSSNLCEYVEEKTNGEYKAKDVTRISLFSLRNGEINVIKHQLLEVDNFNKIIVNALDYDDVCVFCVALYKALAEGKRFMFRTAASFVKVVGGVSDRPLLTANDMITTSNNNGGIIVVGSHTEKTTRQLEQLRNIKELEFIEFQSDLVLEDKLDMEVDRVVGLCESKIKEGKTVVCYTNRKLLTVENDTPKAALLRSVKISDGVSSLVGNLKVTPAFVIAKGGITSSDVGVKALKVKQALVLGQIRPGIPVWKTGSESRFPDIPYVIFPGNVGEDETLREAVEILLDR